jgi:Ca2+-transporting ATPase
LVAAVGVLVLANRSSTLPLVASLRRPNAALWWVLAAASVLLGLAVGVPVLRELFNFAVPGPLVWAGVAITGLALLPMLHRMAISLRL